MRKQKPHKRIISHGKPCVKVRERLRELYLIFFPIAEIFVPQEDMY